MSTLESFIWDPRPGMTIEHKPDVTVVKFGDGYEQRRAKGLNSLLKKYSVTFRLTHENGRRIEDFFVRHGVVKAFLFRCPFKHKLVKTVCRSWTSNVQNTVVDVTAVFEEVVA